jgi:Pectate lyase superfamily protein
MKKLLLLCMSFHSIIVAAQQPQTNAPLSNDTLSARVPGMVFEKVGKRTVNANPKVVGVKSAAELRTMNNVSAADTQFLIQLTNYSLNYTQHYQYDPNDQTSIDNGATIIKAGSKVFRAIFPEGIVNVKIFGAKGDGTANDHPAIQSAINTIIGNNNLPRNLYFPKGSYRIDSPLIVYKWTGTDYDFCSINLVGTEASHFSTQTWESRIICSFNNSFAIGFQRARSSKVKGISIEGKFNPPPPGDWMAYYLRPYATWASAYGVRDSRWSPYAGVVFDPFRFINSPPPDGGYPGRAGWYRGSGRIEHSGSSGVIIEECRITGFTCGILISPSEGSKQGDNMIINRCTLERAKVAIASCDRQNKDNYATNNISWDRVHTLFSGDYGLGQGTIPYVNGYNSAGSVVQIFTGIGALFPVTIQGIFAEQLYRIGDISSGSGPVEMIGCNFDFNVSTNPYCIPPTHFTGNNVKFRGCTIRYYDDSANRRLYFKGSNISFDHCWFDKPPFGQFDHNVAHSLPVMEFTECTTFNNELLGWRNIRGKISPGGYKLVEGGTIDIEDAGLLTTSSTGLRSLRIHIEGGSFLKFQAVGKYRVVIDSMQRKGRTTVPAAVARQIAASDYLLFGDGYDSMLGRITAVNYSTGVIDIADVPLSVKTGSFDMVATYYKVLRGFAIGKTTKGSNVIDSVKFGNIFGPPIVGDRAGIGFPEAIITAVGAGTITLSENAYYSRSQDYRPLSSNEKIEVTSFFDPSHANLDAFQQLIPQNTIWKVNNSPVTNRQRVYKFVKGGYIRPKTFGQTLQSVWQLSVDDNPDAFSISEAGNVSIGNSSIDNDARLQVDGDVYTARHIITNPKIAGYSPGPGEGNGGSRNVSGGDVAGKIVINTGSATAKNSIIGTLSFSNKYRSAPYVVLTPGNANAAALSGGAAVFVTTTAATLVLNSGSTALTPSAQYVWYYHVMN